LLHTLRYSLRQMMIDSHLLNTKDFVRQLETVYQKILQSS